jgi:WD40 repeat protein
MSRNALPRPATDESSRPNSPSLLTRGLSLVRPHQDSPDEEISKRSALLSVLVDRLRLNTRADGAMIALRETKDAPLVCRASTGRAPARGSRLKLPESATDNCATNGFSLSSRCSVLVGGKPFELAATLLVPLPSGPTDGIVGVFSRDAHFTTRDWQSLQEVARLFPPALEPEENHRKLWIFASVALLLFVTWVAVRYQQQNAEQAAVPATHARIASPSVVDPSRKGKGGPARSLTSPVLDFGRNTMLVTSKPNSTSDSDLAEPPFPESSVFSPDPLDAIAGRLPLPSAKPEAALDVRPLAPTATEKLLTSLAKNTIVPPEAAPNALLVRPTPGALQNPSLVLTRTIAKGHSGWVTGLAFSADGSRLTTGGWDSAMKTWDVASGAALAPVAGSNQQIQAVADSPDGQLLAAETADHGVTLWNAADGRQLRKLQGDKPPVALKNSWVYSIAFSPNSKWLASGINNQTVRIWDVKSGEIVRDLTGKKRAVVYMAFSPDGRLLATGDDDKNIVLWDIANGRVMHTLHGHDKAVLAVAFSHDGRKLASASADKTIKLWDVAGGNLITTLRGHHDRVTTLAFTPGGRWLASGGWDGTVRIWDVDAASEFEEIPAHSKEIFSLAFDHRGDWLAAGSSDGTVRVWRFLENHQ